VQLYVMVPGNPQPQLLGIDEIVSRIRAGTLPATADVVRLGESKWVPAKELPEIAAKLDANASQAGAPPPPPPPGPSETSPLGSLAGSQSPLGSQAGAPSPLASQGGAPSPLASQGGAPSSLASQGGAPSPLGSLAGSQSPLASQGGAPSPLGPPPTGPSPFASLQGEAPALFGGTQAAQPSPLASQGGQPAPVFQSTSGQVQGVGGSPPGHPQATAAPATSPIARLAGRPIPKGALIGGAAGLAVLVFGIIALVWYRNSYTRGLVLEHVPEDCAELIYVDIEGIASSDPVKPSLEKGLKNAKGLAQDTTKSHKDKDRMEEALAALQKNGIDTRSIREIAICIRPSDDGKSAGSLEENGLIVLGGTFRKGDPLNAIKEALEAGTGREDLCKIEDDDIKLLKCSVDKGDKRAPFYAGLLEGRVLAVSSDKKLLKSVRANKNVAKTYGANKGEHFVRFTSKEAMSFDGTYGDTKLKIGSNDTVLAIETYYDADKGKAKLAEIKDPDAFVKKKEGYFKAAAKACFANAEDFDMLADAVESAKVEAFEDGAKYEIKVPNKDLAKLFKRIADADLKDVDVLSRLSGCIMRTVEPLSAGSPPAFGYE
jgi:hypothetical protein